MKKLLWFLIVLILIAGGFFAWMFFNPAAGARPGTLYIKTGSTYEDVRKELVEKKFLSNDTWFALCARLLKYNKVKPGRYVLKQNTSLFDLVRMLRAGRQTPVNFVITKFRIKEDFAKRAGNSFEFDSLDMINYLNNADTLKDYGLDTTTVIAAMMPYTYTLKWNSRPQDLFEKCFSAFKKFWTKDRLTKADSIGLDRMDVITLASIIEEETNNASEKPNMASVYLNRIKKGMPLQADPTVKFAMRDFALRRILYTHLQTISPYNTYVNKGLPPGPICTPSIETIDAVLNSPKTDYIYFVASSNFDGSHVFTSNYDDHLKYAREYQKALDRRWDSLKQAKPKQP